jgi:hypothetical protein
MCPVIDFSIDNSAALKLRDAKKRVFVGCRQSGDHQGSEKALGED